MPARKKVPVSEHLLDAVERRVRQHTKPLLQKSGTYVTEAPTRTTIKKILEKIDHPNREALFAGGGTHFTSTAWRGKTCADAPRHGNVYLRRLLHHWFVAPLRPQDELKRLCRQPGCANPHHSAIKDANHIAEATARFASGLVDKAVLVRLLNVRGVKWGHGECGAHDAHVQREHAHALRVCTELGLHEAGIAPSRFVLMACALRFSVRNIAMTQYGYFQLVLKAIQTRVDATQLPWQQDPNAGPDERPWLATMVPGVDSAIAAEEVAQALRAVIVGSMVL